MSRAANARATVPVSSRVERRWVSSPPPGRNGFARDRSGTSSPRQKGSDVANIETPGAHHRETTPEGIFIEWDVPIEMDDGLLLRADIFRPVGEGQYPVIMTYGPYGKGLPFQQGYETSWKIMARNHPDATTGSTNRFQNWEVPDPEKWVPEGYICIRVDSRGAGRSPGHMNLWSARETYDYYQCIEWAGSLPFSNGKVGLNGISYYAMNQWQVAALQPPHLAAICVWEGAGDWYRDQNYHGGMFCTFLPSWFRMQVTTVQYGRGADGPQDPNSGLLVCGDETLTEEERAANRTDFGAQVSRHPLIDELYCERTPDYDKITVPLLSAGNWGGQGLHLRGNIEGYLRAGSSQKWLEMHGLEHWSHFYTDYGRQLQLRFFDHFLKGRNNSWQQQPPLQLNIRHVDSTFVLRAEQAWPLERTEWTRYYLDADTGALNIEAAGSAASIAYGTTGDGASFTLGPLSEQTEITGPIAAKLFVETTTVDADLFLVVRVSTAPWTLTPPSPRAGCAPRNASSTTSSPSPTGRTTPTTRSSLSNLGRFTSSTSRSGLPA
jgi:predicted acyl esterase